MRIILAHGYIAHVVDRKSEVDEKKRNPKKKKKARRWVVEARHGGFDRFRKLLALRKAGAHLPGSQLPGRHIIALRKIILPGHLIYGSVLRVASAWSAALGVWKLEASPAPWAW